MYYILLETEAARTKRYETNCSVVYYLGNDRREICRRISLNGFSPLSEKNRRTSFSQNS